MPLARVSAGSLTELRGAVLALKATDRTIRSAIGKATRAELGTIWKQEVAGRVQGMPAIDQAVLGRGVRVKAGNPSTLIAAASTRPLSGGLVPDRDYAGFEFGTANRDQYSTYSRRSPKGTVHQVKRRTTRHLPGRRREGRAIWPAFAETGPRLTSLWVQIIVREIYEALEGGK